MFVVRGCLAILFVSIAPIVVFAFASIVPWLIIMKLYAHIFVAIAIDIGGYDEASVVKSERGVADIGLNNEVTLQVVAACGSHHINKSLVIGVLHLQVFGRRLVPVVFYVHLVGASKRQAVVVLRKL